MYEVEFKVEITDKEREKLINLFDLKRFPMKGISQQRDFYIEAKESPYKGYDIKRYREEDEKYIFTLKTWEMVGHHPFRKEEEHEVTKEEFDIEVAKYPNAVKINKKREWFGGRDNDIDVSISIDSVKFDHSPEMRYFMEGEIQTEDKAEVVETKKMIENFLRKLLAKKEIVEAPGMFVMAFKKQ